MVEAIRVHSAGFADAAEGNLTAAVEHCPAWDVAGLVRHLTDVHWFWSTIVAERLDAPPDESRRPTHDSDEGLLDVFRAGADTLVGTLLAANPATQVWTWAPAQHDVAFVTRHQVQEAAVHHWDAMRARGRNLEIEPDVAADSVDEFLTFSLSTDADPADPPRPPLEGAFVLRCTDLDVAWTVTEGGSPGTVAATRGGASGIPELAAPASDLLLWLYGRVALDAGEVPADLLDRFRALSFTD